MSKSFNKFVARNKIGSGWTKEQADRKRTRKLTNNPKGGVLGRGGKMPQRKWRAEDDPGWRASKDGDKTGWERGVWYEKGKRTSRFGPH